MTVRNLSEKLFKPKFNYPETSSLIQRIDSKQIAYNNALDGQTDSRWYRVLNPLLWHWRGLPILEIEAVLSRIAASDKKQTNEQWLDSVIGYQSGNWIYEFLSQANLWQQKAEAICDSELNDEMRKALQDAWLISSQFCRTASYPHYKTDDLATQAQVYAYKAYKEALTASPFTYKEIEFKVSASSVKGILHLPDVPVGTACPIVFMCGGLTNLQLDFYRYFADYLAPQGIGLLTIDSPGIGLSRSFNLTQNSSEIYQAVLEQLPSVPWIDHTNVILAGFRFGTHAATRLSYLAPNRIKGLLCFTPMVHQLFVDKTLQSGLPVMYRDVIASRLGLTSSSNQQLAAELNYFSLKNQGLIGRPCSVPIMSVVFDNDPLSALNEAKLLTSTKQSKIITVASSPLQQSLEKALKQSTDWLTALVK